jgi:hypothetical protein
MVAYKKFKSLWNDYKKVSHLENDPETLKKFKKFLDNASNLITSNLIKILKIDYIDNSDKKIELE